ncbi:MAG: GAF domain-containing protein [Bacteroidota bacterium]
MARFISSLVTVPDITEEQKRATQRLLRNILYIVVVTSVSISVIDVVVYQRYTTAYALGSLAVAAIVSLFYLHRQVIWPARVVIPLGALIALSYLLFVGNGVHDIAISGITLVLILAGITLGGGALVIFGVLSALAVLFVGIAEMRGYIPNGFGVTFSDILIIAIAILAGAFLLRLLLNRLQQVILELQKSEKEQIEANTELRGLKESLEMRVSERTREIETRTLDLETANNKVKARAAQFEALAQVSQDISSIRDLGDLLPRIATVISEKFGFYHVGVFLLDDVSEYAILSATNSTGGRRMLERKHRLRVGEQGIVGKVTQTGIPRVAMDVGEDAVYFDNPDLPDTHSEMALPLLISGQIIGALDVQSIATGAFTNEDIQMLSLLAGQVSLAIENARLFEETRRALAESEASSRKSIREAWKKLPADQRLLGYRYSLTGITSLEKPLDLSAPDKNITKTSQAEIKQIVVPIELRGENIGSLIVQSPASVEMDQDRIDLIKAVAERVAISAENARLFDETTRRAERERTVSEITGKIRSVNDPQAMIQIAIEELRSVLGATRVEIIPQKIQGTQ